MPATTGQSQNGNKQQQGQQRIRHGGIALNQLPDDMRLI